MSTICEEIHRELIRLKSINNHPPIAIEHISLSNQAHTELRHSVDLAEYFRHEIGQAPNFLGVEVIVDVTQRKRFIVQARNR
jgi:hypothetical protein